MPLDATLGEAMSALKENAGGRDVFITRSGKPQEPLLGWLTNIDIQRHCRI